MRGGVGEKALRQIIDNAYRVADRCLPQDAAVIRHLADDISKAVNALCELRADGKGQTPLAEQLARDIRDKLGNLERAVTKAVAGVDKAGHQAAHTVSILILSFSFTLSILHPKSYRNHKTFWNW